MKKVLVIIGSNRPIRFGGKVGRWAHEIAQATSESIDFEIIDLAKLNLPYLDEPKSPAKGDYQHEHTLAWAKTVGEADGFVFVGPVYNGGYSAVLKNAIDTVYAEWQDKPAAIVGYGGGTTTMMVDSLRVVLDHIGMNTLKEQVVMDGVYKFFDEDGKINTDAHDDSMRTVVQALEASLA